MAINHTKKWWDSTTCIFWIHSFSFQSIQALFSSSIHKLGFISDRRLSLSVRVRTDTNFSDTFFFIFNPTRRFWFYGGPAFVINLRPVLVPFYVALVPVTTLLEFQSRKSLEVLANNFGHLERNASASSRTPWSSGKTLHMCPECCRYYCCIQSPRVITGFMSLWLLWCCIFVLRNLRRLRSFTLDSSRTHNHTKRKLRLYLY